MTNHWTEVDWTGLDTQKHHKYDHQKQNGAFIKIPTTDNDRSHQQYWTCGMLNPCPPLLLHPVTGHEYQVARLGTHMVWTPYWVRKSRHNGESKPLGIYAIYINHVCTQNFESKH